MNHTIDCWYGVWCKPRQELVAEENLRRQGFHVYLPRILTRQRRRGKWVAVVEALFPRYIFIRVDAQTRSISSVRSTRGAIGLVSFGREPAIVPDEVMNMLLQREDSELGLRKDDRPLFCNGDLVKLVDGPLAGAEGVFDHEDGEKRVLVLLELLGKTNRISVNRDSVVRAA
ncbi:MAG: transcription/translation regulatory transformer protein RfaH [Betaproteobacteria bacterium]|nr:transcription/translation regulatory transformer protein RfaH [Betaproteobacteria bacterium]